PARAPRCARHSVPRCSSACLVSLASAWSSRRLSISSYARCSAHERSWQPSALRRWPKPPSSCWPDFPVGTLLIVPIAQTQPMLANRVITIFRVLTWCCVIVLAVLSLLPAQELADLSLLP